MMAGQALIFPCVGAFVYVPLRKYFGELNQMVGQIPLDPDHPYLQLLHLREHQLEIYLFSALTLGIALSAVLNLYISQRVAGSLLGVKNYFEEIERTGELPRRPLRFRNDDFFQELPGIMNNALKKLTQK